MNSPRLGADWQARFGARRGPTLLLLTGTLLGLGGVLHLVGLGTESDRLWIAGGSVGAAYSAWNVFDSLRHRRLGVDVIALLALLGTIIIGEYLAGAVISLMVASGQALEGWAAGRARRDLRALLERAPRTARRHDSAGGLEMVAVDAVAPGDLLLIGAGELVPVDGTVMAWRRPG